MSDEEIKKALECCADKDGASCKHCPYNSDCSKGGIRMLTDSLALINRQQADIERLQKKYDRAMGNIKAVLNGREDDQNV